MKPKSHTGLTLMALTCLINGIYCLDNGLARTPPMGWLTWQRYRCQTDCVMYPNDCISETLMKRMARKLASDGWLQAGYRYVIIDDCWPAKERDNYRQEIIPDTDRFPEPLSRLADYIHSLGLLFGIYLDYGTLTCARYPGSMNYLEIDAKSLVKWKVDYVKMDGCYSPLSKMESGYENFSKYMNDTGRPMVFSCSYPAYIPWFKDHTLINWTRLQNNCNLWRMLDDVQDSWASVISIIEAYRRQSDLLASLAGPGHWNDPDMLLLGNYGLSDDQKRVQMGMWCMFAAPLIISADLYNMDQYSKELLLNTRLLAIDQDTGGHQAEYVQTRGNVQFWLRQLNSPKLGWAIACLNLADGGGPVRLLTSLAEFKSKSYFIHAAQLSLTDVFTGKKIRTLAKEDTFLISINPSGIVMYRIDQVGQTLNE